MPIQPLAEVFGFPADSFSEQASRYRRLRLCPYHNVVASCTKDKAANPLGVCSVLANGKPAITCPIRFRQDWRISEDAARFFFPPGTQWTQLSEVQLNDRNGQSAGNIDHVLIAYDEHDRILDFGSLEVQAVYISGNVRRPFEAYVKDPRRHLAQDWTGGGFPRPDYLSSSRKRLAPQLIFKGGILNAWKKKQAVALNSGFYETLPKLPEVDPSDANLAWFVYDLERTALSDNYQLKLVKTVFTDFRPALKKITTPLTGNLEDFLEKLQEKLGEKLENISRTPSANAIFDAVAEE